jgi:hypothetical protein
LFCFEIIFHFSLPVPSQGFVFSIIFFFEGRLQGFTAHFTAPFALLHRAVLRAFSG